MLKKQAKVLSATQIKAVMQYLDSCPRNSLRNQIIFLLSIHGLRSKEIAELQMSMITDSSGEISSSIALEDKDTKGRSGRAIPMNERLRESLTKYIGNRRLDQDSYVIVPERSAKFSANAIAVFFKRLYTKLGFVGCSSHSGRRTFITNCARKISQTGGSIRDVMSLAGHKNLQTTQLYIEQNEDAQKCLVKLLYTNI